MLGEGATIRYQHRKVVWTEGAEEFSAAESYDRVAQVIAARAGTSPFKEAV